MGSTHEELIDLPIERLGIHGEGVGRYNSFTLFVDGVLPGEKVRAQICEKRRKFGRAKAMERLTTSQHRVTPPCPVFGKCGGCQLMHLDYPEQLKTKQQRVQDALQRIGKFFNCAVLPCIPSPSPLAYRNKIQLTVEAERVGLNAHQTHALVPIEQCMIHCPLGEKAFQHIQQLRRHFPASLKQILIKSAINTEQVLIVLFADDKATDLAHALLRAMPEIKGVVQKSPSGAHTLVGQPWIEEKLCDLSFKLSPSSFLQVNIAQAEQLYAKVLEFLDLSGDEVILDAYCGIGTLSLLMAKHAKAVIGIESLPEAVSDAQENALHNGISNVKFLCSRVESSLCDFEVDVAVLNPPRGGCERPFLEKLAALNPKRIVYVSCDPATLARDLQLLCHKGYFLEKVQPFDMFPQTAHVECVVQLSKKNFIPGHNN